MAMAASSTSKPRRSSWLSIIFLSVVNLLLFFLASASFAPLFLLRPPPSSLGWWALFAVSSTTLLSSLLGFCSQLIMTHLFFFVLHIALVLVSSVGQALGFLSLFLRPGRSLKLLRSARSLREQRLLMKVEEGVLVAMFVVQSAVLVSSCLVQQRWRREYEEAEAEKEKSVRKRSRRMARVQEEAMVNAAAIAEAKTRELEEKMKNKVYGQLG